MAERKKQNTPDNQDQLDPTEDVTEEHESVAGDPPPPETEEEAEARRESALEASRFYEDGEAALERDQMLEEAAQSVMPPETIFRPINDEERAEDRRFGQAYLDLKASPEDRDVKQTYEKELLIYMEILDNRARGKRSGEHEDENFDEAYGEDDE